MAFLPQGSSAQVAITAGQSIAVGAVRGGTANVTFPVGYPKGPSSTVNNTTAVYGPFATATTVTVYASQGTAEYVTGTSPVCTDGPVALATDPLTGVVRLATALSTADMQGGTPVSRPSGLSAAFATYANFDIWRNASGVVWHNFDRKAWCPTPDVTPWVTQNTYYVDGTSGADGNTGLTWALAKKSISAAITAGNTAAAPYVVYVRAGTYVRSGGTALYWGATAPSQACAFIAMGGRVVSTVSDLLTWTIDTGTTYKATRSNSTRVFDVATKDTFGDYAEIPKASPYTLTQVRLQANSWYTDGTTVYVNRGDAAVVADANTRVFLTAVSGAKCSTSGNTYVNGFDFEGGNQYAFAAVGNASGRVFTENCTFKYNTDATYNALTVLDVAAFGADKCVAAKGASDGFNAHLQSATYPFMLTIGCVGRSNGISGSTSCNGLTTHDGCSALDIGGTYYNNYGGNVAIVNPSTHLWCVGTRAFDSLGDIPLGGSVPSADFLTDQLTPTLWLDGCVSSGSTYGIYKPSGTVNVRGGYIAQGLNGATAY